MSDKAELLIFGRQVEPDWQTRIDKAQRELREYIDDLEGWLPAPDPHEELWGQQ